MMCYQGRKVENISPSIPPSPLTVVPSPCYSINKISMTDIGRFWDITNGSAHVGMSNRPARPAQILARMGHGLCPHQEFSLAQHGTRQAVPGAG